MKDSQLVRKVTSDVTGTQFEIFKKKKTHVFICPTSENCTVWVRALQAAMALKDYRPCSPCDFTDTQETPDLYETYDQILIQTQTSSDGCVKICDYTEPYDQHKVNGVEIKENEYCEVGDVQIQQDKSQQLSQSNNVEIRRSSRQSIVEQVDKDGESEEATVDQYYTDACSLAQTLEGTPSRTSQNIAEVAQRCSTTRKGDQEVAEVAQRCSTTRKDDPEVAQRCSTTTKDDPEVAEVTQRCSITTKVDQVCSDSLQKVNLADLELNSQDLPSTEDDANLFQVLLDALPDRSSPLPNYIHPLTDEDWRPIEDLKQFLIDNEELCPVSYTFVPVSDDPVKSLKSYLETSCIAPRLSGHGT